MYYLCPYSIVYDIHGRPFWAFNPDVIKPNVTDVKPNDVKPNAPTVHTKPGTYRTRMGKWEEVYDALDGTKTWYNTVTKTMTKNDPFW